MPLQNYPSRFKKYRLKKRSMENVWHRRKQKKMQTATTWTHISRMWLAVGTALKRRANKKWIKNKSCTLCQPLNPSIFASLKAQTCTRISTIIFELNTIICRRILNYRCIIGLVSTMCSFSHLWTKRRSSTGSIHTFSFVRTTRMWMNWARTITRQLSHTIKKCIWSCTMTWSDLKNMWIRTIWKLFSSISLLRCSRARMHKNVTFICRSSLFSTCAKS